MEDGFDVGEAAHPIEFEGVVAVEQDDDVGEMVVQIGQDAELLLAWLKVMLAFLAFISFHIARKVAAFSAGAGEDIDRGCALKGFD